MSQGMIFTAAKWILVAALMSYVFYSIQWRDTMLQRYQDTETVTFGSIEGRWDASEVTFLPEPSEDAPNAIRVSPGLQSNNEIIEITPGFFTYLRNIRLHWFILGAGCYFLTVMFSGLRWWWLMHVNSLRVSPLEALKFTWIGVFFNNVVPGNTGGDVVKSVYIMKRCPDRRVAAVFSVIVDRALGMTALALLSALIVLPFLQRFQAVAVGVWGFLVVIVLGTLAVTSQRVRRVLRLDNLLRTMPSRITEALNRVGDAIRLYRTRVSGMVLWTIGSMFNHALGVTSVLLVGYSLNVGVPWLEYYVLVPVINIVSALPLAPNGWGVGEALYGQLFSQYGATYITDAIDPEQVMRTRGVALSILFRVHITMWSLLGGILILLQRDRITQKDIETEVGLEREEEGATHTDSTHIRS
ncbi:MAG: flippase-like domain-containing protein [Gammaproteobacteria bacterium]|nr:flippase-like domain-containing protein [Gammaproteobacteria bacterium]